MTDVCVQKITAKLFDKKCHYLEVAEVLRV